MAKYNHIKLQKDFMQAFNNLPYLYSSKQFAEEARRIGIDDIHIAQGRLATFSHSHATQLNSTRMWTKKPRYANTKIETQETISTGIDEMTEESCIKFLKEKGYNITKLIQF